MEYVEEQLLTIMMYILTVAQVPMGYSLPQVALRVPRSPRRRTSYKVLLPPYALQTADCNMQAAICNLHLVSRERRDKPMGSTLSHYCPI